MNINFSREKSFLIRLFKKHKCEINYEMVQSIPMGMILCKICGKSPNFLEAQGWLFMNTEPYTTGKKKYVWKGK